MKELLPKGEMKMNAANREDYKCKSCGAIRKGYVSDPIFIECYECENLAKKVSATKAENSNEIDYILMKD